MADWRVATLKAIKAPVTKSNLQFLGSWQRWEGGATNNNATYNWLNTTHGNYPAINSVGVKAYPNFQTGVSVLAGVLQSGYPTITKLLRSGRGAQSVTDPSGQADLNKWLTGNPTSGASSYIQKIAGTLGVRFPLAAGSSGNPGSTIKGSFPANTTGSANPVPISPWNAQSLNLQPLAGVGKPVGGGRFLGTPQIKTVTYKSGALPPLTVQHQNTPIDSHAKGVVSLAREYLGTKYVWGGNAPGGFDCSGFVQWVYGHMGVSLPHYSFDQMKMGQAVNPANLKAGDVLFFNGGEHEALYIGNNKVIQAPHTGTVVQITPLSQMGNITAARRML